MSSPSSGSMRRTIAKFLCACRRMTTRRPSRRSRVTIGSSSSAPPPPTRPYRESFRRYFDYEHHQPILASGGARVARTVAEFRQYLKEYLANPELDRAGRKKIVATECWRIDGRSSHRVAEALLAAMGHRGEKS